MDFGFLIEGALKDAELVILLSTGFPQEKFTRCDFRVPYSLQNL